MPAVNAVALVVTQDQVPTIHRRLEVDPLVEASWLELPSDVFILNCHVEGLMALRAAGKLGVAEPRSDSVEICFISTCGERHQLSVLIIICCCHIFPPNAASNSLRMHCCGASRHLELDHRRSTLACDTDGHDSDLDS